MLLLLNREVKEVEHKASECEERLQGWKDQLEAAERWEIWVALKYRISQNYRKTSVLWLTLS